MQREQENLFQCLSGFIDAGIDPVGRHAEIWSRYGETVAVLIVDSSGFSRTTKSLGIIHVMSRLMLLRNIIRPIFKAQNCKHLNFSADNAFAYFDHVTEAIVSASELHRTIYESGMMLTDNERFQISIGIGYGEMLYSETLEGYFSEEVNAASKLGEDLASGDQTLLTAAAFNNAPPHLVEGFTPQHCEISGVTLQHYRQVFEP